MEMQEQRTTADLVNPPCTEKETPARAVRNYYFIHPREVSGPAAKHHNTPASTALPIRRARRKFQLWKSYEGKIDFYPLHNVAAMIIGFFDWVGV